MTDVEKEKTRIAMEEIVKGTKICLCSAARYTDYLNQQFCWMYCGHNQDITKKDIKKIEKAAIVLATK